MIRVAINGYGRIGRVAHRIIVEEFNNQLDVVAINAGSSTDLQGWMYLLQYDSVYGAFPHELSVTPNTDEGKKDLLGTLSVDGKEIPLFSQKDPSLLPWKEFAVDVVIESTGHFRSKDKMELHLTAGAKAVVLSAPEKGGDPSTGHSTLRDEPSGSDSKSSGQGVETFVLSVNDQSYTNQTLISCASCTTNSIAPVAKVMEETFGIEKAMLTTIHGYTSDQRLQDGGHKDYRRARAAGFNIIPTSTGATKAAAKALPSLKDRFSGLALRVPVPVGSLSDLTFLLKKETTVEEVNQAFKHASTQDTYKGILAVTDDPIVSSDIIGSSYSSIVDLSLTQVVLGNMVKVIAWYDNEYGYANRLVEEVVMVGEKLASS